MSFRGAPARPLAALDRFVFAAEDPRRLAGLRIALFGLLALRLAVNDYGFVAGQPAALFDPVSLFHLLEQMPSPELVGVLRLVGIGAALAAAAGLLPRLSFPLTWAIAVFLGLMLNSTGKIVHNDVLLLLCIVPLLAAPRDASATWSLSRRVPAAERPRPGGAYGWPIRTAMLVCALAYLFAGLQKLRYSGIEWVTSENLRWVLYSASDGGGEPNQLALLVADHAWLSHLLAGGTLALELGFVLVIPFAALRWLLVPSVVALHLGIWLTMGLDYSAQALTVVAVFVNWAALADAVGARGQPRTVNSAEGWGPSTEVLSRTR